MKLLGCLFALILGSLPLYAETPWAAAETLRAEAGRIERLMYRAETPGRTAEMAGRLRVMAEALAMAEPPFGVRTQAAFTAFAGEVAAERAAGVARWRQMLWAALMGEARDHAAAAIAGGDAGEAAKWLTIRDYARASGDTAAALALKALAEGGMPPQQVQETVTAELLATAASELRLALDAAAEDAAAGHRLQYAGKLGRIEGLVQYLDASLTDALGPEGAALLQSELRDAATDPAAVGRIAARLAQFAPVTLSAAERLRRARLLRRFTALVAEEYRDAVRDGAVSQPMEYQEARLFRNRAAMILGDLAQAMDPEPAARLAGLLHRMKIAIEARASGVDLLAAEALTEIDAAFGAEASTGGYAAAIDALPAALDEMALMARSGDWPGAELKRLEAYSWFDPDIEQRLVPRAPAMALRLEARFWEGTAARPGLGALIAAQAEPARLAAEIGGVKADLAAARTRIEARPSVLASLLQSAGIIFREGLEAVLILAALLAALRAEGHAPARFRPVLFAAAGLALGGSLLLWAAVRWLIALSTLAREALEGGTTLVAAAVLTWLVLGLSGGSGQAGRFRSRLPRVANPLSVGLLAFLVVFREGFETVLFYEALLADAAPGLVLTGFAAGLAAALLAGWAVLVSGLRLPLRLFFRATTILLAGLAVMLTGAGIRGLQTAALIGATPVGWFPYNDVLQLWLGLFPVAEPLAAQAIVLGILAGLPPFLHRRARAPRFARG